METCTHNQTPKSAEENEKNKKMTLKFLKNDAEVD